MNRNLSLKERIVVAALYFFIIIGIGYSFSNDWQFVIDTNNPLNYVLIATALTFILSAYITEPFFTRPADVIVKWVAILLLVIGINSKDCLSLYQYWVSASLFFILLAIILIFFHNPNKPQKYQKMGVDIICWVSRPQIIFAFLYFDIVVSFFRFKPVEYPILIGFGVLLFINQPIVAFVKVVTNFINRFKSKADNSQLLGQIIGHDSEDLYKVEIASDNPLRQEKLKGKLVYLECGSNGTVGIIFTEEILLGKKWVQVLSLRKNGNLIVFNKKAQNTLSGDKTIYSKTNAVYILESEYLPDSLKQIVENNPIKKYFPNLIGYVTKDSTISKIRFAKLFSSELMDEQKIGEGTIIQTEIGGKETLYQIIDAKTDEEYLEHKDAHGFMIGVAQKLGWYNPESNELDTVKWLPEIYTPIFLLNPKEVIYNYEKFVGRLPNTNYGIGIKNINELITHNTAILGILGIGKSCLTFELLKKIIDNTKTKIVCIDITNEYNRADKLPLYVDSKRIVSDYLNIFKDQLNTNYEKIVVEKNKDNKDVPIPEKSGNKNDYREAIKKDLFEYFFGTKTSDDEKFSMDKRIRIYNPDYHKVSQGEKIGYNVITVDLTQAEKTRIICEEIFRILMKLPLDPDGKSKVLIVFEEAHSLIPEWNSVANEGDKNATNGTAKVILQGRKYGLGSMVITQRTANISKSILNQCNTIFALRVFDDTGKQFLENYIGTDYSNILPTLEERHCVAIGKALKLKQPVILRLNDLDKVICKTHEEIKPAESSGSQPYPSIKNDS